ncbi:MAG: glycosyltransferase family 4 protein [Candidatus Sulfopaludibacter sp.]|nr:glycosyltransferase family 4 protein [Candidatus Sulfopaludibacter sp.]
MPVNPVGKTESNNRTVAFLGNYLPRKCGIATFTSDLLGAVASRHPESRCFAVPVNDIDGRYQYPGVVRFEIEEQELESYQRAAGFLNSSEVDVVSLQHEFGIFGGPAGSHLLTLLRGLRAPVVTTLHTVLLKPDPEQFRVMQTLIAHSARLVVMTERGRTILQQVYGAPSAKVDLIPHGIPDVQFGAPDSYKDQFGVAGRKVLLTFGLLSPNKGIEYVLHALPEIVAEFPAAVYIVLGATHPHELRARGEAYRLGLEAIVRKNKLENHVIFHNRFVELKELTEFIGAADIYITPYLDEGQITSGTLAYAFGAGKAVISTPYWHAAELLRDERGVLVPFADPEAIAREVSGLLRDRTRRSVISEHAYQLGREMVWSKTAVLYMRSFELARQGKPAMPRELVVARGVPGRPHESPELNLGHLNQMTDSMGIFQHARFTTPMLSEGYCTDDNARALILTVLLGQSEEAPKRVRALATTYAAFLQYAFDPGTARFHNFLSVDRHWLDEKGSEDSHGRAIWALGTAVGRSPHWSSQMMAERLFALALPAARDFTSPRAWAFSLIGIHEYLHRAKGSSLAQDVRDELTGRLVTIFDKVAGPDWTWFEEGLTYDNAKLAHALIVSGHATGRRSVCDRGLQALRWLVGVQTPKHDQLRPIGSNGFYQRDSVRADFDQQPIEAHATVSACLEAYRVTADSWWYEQAQSAFDWFLGWNDLGVELYCASTGGCRDGLHPDRANENQGAESMLAFLLSLAEMRLIQNTATGIQRTGVAASVTQ